MADAIISGLWHFVSAIIGGVISGGLIAYSLGRWRGETDQRISALEDRGNQVDDRLEKGSDRLVNIPVLESKFEEVTRSVERMRTDVHEGLANVQKQLDSHSKEFVRRGECDRQHHRPPKSA